MKATSSDSLLRSPETHSSLSFILPSLSTTAPDTSGDSALDSDGSHHHVRTTRSLDREGVVERRRARHTPIELSTGIRTTTATGCPGLRFLGLGRIVGMVWMGTHTQQGQDTNEGPQLTHPAFSS